MTTSNRLLRNISTIYMATAQISIFWLLRTYHFATAHLPIIYVLQIDNLCHDCKSSTYLITVLRKIVGQFQIAYFEVFRGFIWLLCKAQFSGSCASYNYSATAHLPIICLLQSTNYFTTGNRLNIWLLCLEKLYDNFKSPVWKYFENLYAYCAKPSLLATAHHTNILLLRISQLFVYCKSTKFFTNGNCLNICLLCIEKLYVKFKSPIWIHFVDLYGFCANQFLATAHLSFCFCASIILLQRISQFFIYCKSTNYFPSENRLHI